MGTELFYIRDKNLHEEISKYFKKDFLKEHSKIYFRERFKWNDEKKVSEGSSLILNVGISDFLKKIKSDYSLASPKELFENRRIYSRYYTDGAAFVSSLEGKNKFFVKGMTNSFYNLEEKGPFFIDLNYLSLNREEFGFDFRGVEGIIKFEEMKEISSNGEFEGFDIERVPKGFFSCLFKGTINPLNPFFLDLNSSNEKGRVILSKKQKIC